MAGSKLFAQNKRGAVELSLSQKKTSFRRFFTTAALGVATIMNINVLSPNHAMAQAVAEKPPTKKELSRYAEQAVAHLADFIKTGNTKSASAFMTLWRQYKDNDTFFYRIEAEINKKPELFEKLFITLHDRYKRWLKLDEVVGIVYEYYGEIQKPVAERDMAGLRAKYGSKFVSAMNSVASKYPTPRKVTPKPKAKPKPTTAKPVPTKKKETDKQTMERMAHYAAANLEEYIVTGDEKKKKSFTDAWKKYNQNDDFYRAFEQAINERAEVFGPLFKAYRDNKYEQDTKKGLKVDKDECWPTPEELLRAVEACHAELKKPLATRDLPKIRKIYGNEFVKQVQVLSARPAAREVQAPTQVKLSTIDEFIEGFPTVTVSPKATKQERNTALVLAIRDWFGAKNLDDAEVLTTALLRTYERLDPDHRKLFIMWLVAFLTPDDRRALLNRAVATAKQKALRIPSEDVKDSYVQWLESLEEDQRRMLELEQDLKSYPTYIAEGDAVSMAASFEQKPSTYALTMVSDRLEYLEKKLTVLRMKGEEVDRALISEIDQITRWLAALGEVKKTTGPYMEKLAAARAAVAEINGGMEKIQEDYRMLSPENTNLLLYMENMAAQPRLFKIYARYLSALDKTAARVFANVSPEAKKFNARIGDKIADYFDPEKVRSGDYNWYKTYYRLLNPQREDIEDTPILAESFDRVAHLPPLAAVVFYDYLQTVQNLGLDSEQEQRIVATTVRTLNALNPILVVKYLNAIRHIATICEDNPDAFLLGMNYIAQRIDAEAAQATSAVSPAAYMLPLNQRVLIAHIGQALEEVAAIEMSAVARYDRRSLWSDAIRRMPYQPHPILQERLRYMPDLLVPTRRVRGEEVPYFLPDYLRAYRRSAPFRFGSVMTGTAQYTGQVLQPNFTQLQLTTGVDAVERSFVGFLYPQHSLIAVDTTIPGSAITGLDPLKLQREIARAFVSTQRPEYSKEVLGGGVALGATGRKPAEDWQHMGGGIGTLITPTGGASIGGAASEDRVFAGGAVVAVPVGIPIIRGAGADREVVGIQSAIGGYERLDDRTERALVRAIGTRWDPDQDPNKMAEQLIIVNHESDPQGRDVTTARYFYVDKAGTIFELSGGQNDFVRVLNFAAGYADEQFLTPTTYGWNVEPEVDRGGGAIAIDIGKTAVLTHFQSVPFFVPEGQPQPVLLQWTLGVGHTVDADRGTTTHQVTIPGKMLRLKRGADGTQTDDYVVQDITYMARHMERRNAWEIRAGVGKAWTPVSHKYRGGLFYKDVERKMEGGVQTEETRWGTGAFYEAGATNLDALALLQEAEDAQHHVEALHRVGTTMYGRKEEAATRYILGGLAHVVQQLREDRESGQLTPNATLFRFIGIMRGIQGLRGLTGRADIARYSTLDAMMRDYNDLATEIGDDPSRAAELIERFQERYLERFKDIYDNYYLALQWNRDFSIEANLLAVEVGGGWERQIPDRAAGRMLLTWKTGFWRAFASIPMLSGPRSLATQAAEEEGLTDEERAARRRTLTGIGIAGSGVGQDLFNGVFLQRAAADVGILVARYESGDRKWMKAGWFTQGAATLFSNVLADSNEYRKLVTEYEAYADLIRQGEINRIPKAIRELIAKGLRTENFDKRTIRHIIAGTLTRKLEPEQVEFLVRSLWKNFYSEKKYKLQERFDENLRLFLGASGYFFAERTHWDIGTFVEIAKKFRMYGIVANRYIESQEREEIGIYAGAEYASGRWRVAAMGGKTRSAAATAASLGIQVGTMELPVEVALTGYAHTERIPEYVAPAYSRQNELLGIPEYGAILSITLGGGREMLDLQVPGAPRLNYPTGNY